MKAVHPSCIAGNLPFASLWLYRLQFLFSFKSLHASQSGLRVAFVECADRAVDFGWTLKYYREDRALVLLRYVMNPPGERSALQILQACHHLHD
jgi:hypothetical protein